jgi:L-alanine-DL-glutamate epimerase-like enolase superfamily enzyme
MLEQPLPAKDDAALKNFIHPLPVCADESCHTRENLSALKGAMRWSILSSTRPAADRSAGPGGGGAGAGVCADAGLHALHIRAIGAALPLVNQVRFADLDGPTWLAVDVSPALNFTSGVLHL